MADAQCRTREGYVCDPAWHACLIPNTAAIVPRTCGGIGSRDPAWGPVAARGRAFDPAAIVADDGGVVAIAATHDGGLVTLRGAATAAFAAHGDQVQLARDGGTLHAVWCSDAQAEVASSRDRGATWSPPVGVRDAADATCERPAIAVGRGAVYVAYGGEGWRVRASRDGGRTFAPAVTALAGRRGALAVGSDGRLHALALDGSERGGYGSADQRVQYAVSSDGGATFTRPRTVSGGDEALPFYFAIPRLAVDDKRRWLYAVYVRGGRTGVWDLVVAASKDKGETWKRVRIGDDARCALHLAPALALDATTGQLHVAWYDNRGGGRFAHAVCAPGLASCVQPGRISDALFALPALDPARTGEQAVLLVDERRRTLHALWAQAGDLAATAAALPAR